MCLRSLFGRCCVIRLRWLWWLAYSRTCPGPGSLCRIVGNCAPEVRAGSCAGPSGGPSFVIRVVLFVFVAARVQFDLGGPGFVTIIHWIRPSYKRTADPAQPQLDVIQLFPSSSGSGLSTLLSSAVMLISPLSALLRWDFVCNFRAIERNKNWEHAKGHYTFMHVCDVGNAQKALMLQ